MPRANKPLIVVKRDRRASGLRRGGPLRYTAHSVMPYSSKERQAAYQAKWLRDRREQWLQENGPCVRCGSWVRLEVDHREEGQKVSHRVWGWSKERRERELAKCQPLCKLCHRAKTNAHISHLAGPADHGRAYRRGCRCVICRGWNAIRRRIRTAGLFTA